MSRIGKLPVSIPAGVTVDIDKDNNIKVKGPKGELVQNVNSVIKVELKDNEVIFTPTDEAKQTNAMHGLYRSLVYNMVEGVSKGYHKELELVGVGFRASNKGQMLDLSLGYTHNIILVLSPEIKVETKSERNKNPIIILDSFDKQLIGQVCAKIRSLRKVEPYKGKGVRFVGEIVRRKAGKSAAKK